MVHMKVNRGQSTFMNLSGEVWSLLLRKEDLLIYILLLETPAFMKHSMKITKSTLLEMMSIFSKAGMTGKEFRHIQKDLRESLTPVSYTHLTLPTKRIV